MAGKTATLAIRILGDAKDAQKAFDDTASSAGKFKSGVESAAVPAAAALAGLAAAGISAAKAAAEDAAAADQLALALRNGAGASDASIANTESWISATSKAAAVADDELRPALATLVRATGDVGTSQDALTTALDISAATGKDVESVSTALAKAYGGQTAGLKKLVPGMDDAILASGDMEAIMAELARTTGGAAAEAAGSAAGQMKSMQIAMDEAQESIGAALLPALSSVAKSLAGVADWIGKNTTLFLVIGGVIGVVAGAILALNVAFKAWAVIQKTLAALTKAQIALQWLWNAAISANPIGLIIIAIVALVAAIVILWNKNEAFREFVLGVWDAVVSAVQAAWDAIVKAAKTALDWITNAWQSFQRAVAAVWDWITNAIQVAWSVIVAVGRTYIGIYVAIWDGLKAAVGAVWDWIKSVAQAALAWVVGIVQGYINLIVAIWESIRGAIQSVWDGVRSAAQSALDAILGPIRKVETAFDNVVDAIRSVIEWLGRIKLPDVLRNIGDALSNLNPFSATPGSAAARSVGTASAVGAGGGMRAFGLAPSLSTSAQARGGAPMIVVQGAIDPVAVARQIRQILTNDQRRRGGVVIA